ncbi:MAG: hypothetical protein WA991_03930 [Ornithinimicrobium sp.]
MKREIVDVVRDGLRDAFKQDNVIKAFYSGDPDVIPAFNLPAIVVSKLSDESIADSMADDQVTERIIVKLILDKRDDWTAQTDEVDLTEAKIRRLIEARDETTGRYLDNTVKKVLRETLEQENLLIAGPTTFEIGTLPRPNDVVTMEGHITVPVQHSVPIR